MLIYKISGRNDWLAAEATGRFEGAPVDIADGYIHLSDAASVAETAAKHFAGRRDLVLVAVEAEALGPALTWEVARGGKLFPHLYASLPDRCGRLGQSRCRSAPMACMSFRISPHDRRPLPPAASVC